MNPKNNLCPRCKNKIIGYPAISRIDNKTKICSKCGVIEALEVFINAQRKEVKVNNSYNNKRTSKCYK